MIILFETDSYQSMITFIHVLYRYVKHTSPVHKFLTQLFCCQVFYNKEHFLERSHEIFSFSCNKLELQNCFSASVPELTHGRAYLSFKSCCCFANATDFYFQTVLFYFWLLVLKSDTRFTVINGRVKFYLKIIEGNTFKLM